jgi:myo-inositol-1(or 4)-monophosphatase
MKKSVEYKKFIENLAKDAGTFLKKRIGKIKKVSYKGRMNLVTDVDKRCEDLILKKIKSVYPGHKILSEESGKGGADKSEWLWLIDPLDGTTNYVHGFNFFCVSIALMKNNTLLAGAVYDPMRNELFSAAKGAGAFLNRKRIKVSGVRMLDKALLSTGFPYRFGNSMKQNINNFIKFMEKSQAVRRPGSAALDLCYVASGRFDGFWELELHPWDTAAGVLVVKEAGGHVSNFKNELFNPFMNQIVATNRKLHRKILDVLKKEAL